METKPIAEQSTQVPNNGLIFMDSVEPQEVQWLWYPYIPLGKVTILMGDPGEGKSTLALNIAAAVSRGLAFPDMHTAVTAPDYVIYQNAEDGLADSEGVTKATLHRAKSQLPIQSVRVNDRWFWELNPPRK